MQVPFPFSTTPGRTPGEGQGALLNCHTTKEGDITYWRRAPGLKAFATMPTYPVRGMLASGAKLYVVSGNKVYRVSPDGTYQALYGVVPGSGPVTIDENNVVSSSQKVLVTPQYGAQVIGDAALSTLGVSPVGLVNSVTRVGGYLLFTRPDGSIWATGLNNLSVDAISTATAESDKDGLLRGITVNGIFYAMGTRTIEPWQDIGAEPFPLSRMNTVIQVGLAGPFAVAGVQGEWDNPAFFVASDGTVRSLSGLATEKVSTPDVEHLIARSDPSSLVASIYVQEGIPFWTLSSAEWTVELNVATGSWCERKSRNMTRWRGGLTIKQWGKWFTAHPTTGAIYEIDAATRTEAGEPLTFGADSVPVKDFPSRAVVRSASLDFTLGRGDEGEASPTLKTPVAMVSWSHDGGANWSNQLHRSLGREGRFGYRASIYRLGMTTHHGFRLRWMISDPVDVSFQGASIEVEARRA